MRGALEADQQAAQRGFDVGTCGTHHIINNAGTTTVTVVQMRRLGVVERQVARLALAVALFAYGLLRKRLEGCYTLTGVQCG